MTGFVAKIAALPSLQRSLVVLEPQLGHAAAIRRFHHDTLRRFPRRVDELGNLSSFPEAKRAPLQVLPAVVPGRQGDQRHTQLLDTHGSSPFRTAGAYRLEPNDIVRELPVLRARFQPDRNASLS